jgi:hypothetical protein
MRQNPLVSALAALVLSVPAQSSVAQTSHSERSYGCDSYLCVELTQSHLFDPNAFNYYSAYGAWWNVADAVVTLRDQAVVPTDPFTDFRLWFHFGPCSIGGECGAHFVGGSLAGYSVGDQISYAVSVAFGSLPPSDHNAVPDDVPKYYSLIGYDLYNSDYTVALWHSDLQLAAVAAPEPSTWALLGTGLLALGVVARRRRGTS